jgi:hypothetical protein
MPEPRSRFDKLDADTPHSRWVGRTQINHPASEFFVRFCVSERQQLVNFHCGTQRYQRTVCVHDESLGFLRSHLAIRLVPKNHNINAYADALTSAEVTYLSNLHIASTHGTPTLLISAIVGQTLAIVAWLICLAMRWTSSEQPRSGGAP